MASINQFGSCDDKNLILRELETADFHKEYFRLLSQLTDVGTVSQEQFEAAFASIAKSATSRTAVIEDVAKSKIVASCTLFIEQKFIHSCSKVSVFR